MKDVKPIKPIRTMKIAGKPVQVFNNNPIPKRSVINSVYSKLPDDTNIPLQFMTRKQYREQYIVNQENKNNIDFTPQQEQDFLKSTNDKYFNIVGRYTTRHNPYYPPAVVVFNDKDNLKNIRGNNFKKLAVHEFGHEYAERQRLRLGRQREEVFSDLLADDFIARNRCRPKIVLKKVKNITPDMYSKDSQIYLKPKASDFEKTKYNISQRRVDEIHDRKKQSLMYTNRFNSDNIYIGSNALKNIDPDDENDFNVVANTVAHEEMHNVLTEHIDKDNPDFYDSLAPNASSQFDNLSPITRHINNKLLMGDEIIYFPSNVEFISRKTKDVKQSNISNDEKIKRMKDIYNEEEKLTDDIYSEK